MIDPIIYAKRKEKGFCIGLCRLLCLCFAIFALTGCEGNMFEGLADDSSYEARLEEAMIALDDGDYAKARSILTELNADYPNRPTILQYLSNASAGLAGIDTFNLLETIEQINDNPNAGSIDMIGQILGDTDGVLTADEIKEKIDNINDAISALGAIDDPTDDQIVQLGLLSLNRSVLTIGDVIADDQGIQAVTLTENGISNLYPGNTTPDFSDNLVDDQGNNRLDTLTIDNQNINNSIDSITRISGKDSENDLSENFGDFSDEIDTDGVDGISIEDLENFINDLSA
jgi:hypothetical protein